MDCGASTAGKRRVHQVSASMHSDDFGSDDYQRVVDLAVKLESYARRLGFAVTLEATSEAD